MNENIRHFGFQLGFYIACLLILWFLAVSINPQHYFNKCYNTNLLTLDCVCLLTFTCLIKQANEDERSWTNPGEHVSTDNMPSRVCCLSAGTVQTAVQQLWAPGLSWGRRSWCRQERSISSQSPDLPFSVCIANSTLRFLK